MTINEAKALEYRDTIYQIGEYNFDGTPRRWRVSGQVKTWKRDAERIRVPIKHGLYDNAAIDECNVWMFALTETIAIDANRQDRIDRTNCVLSNR